jgi:YgiT-type zinc finger domain-containing protein
MSNHQPSERLVEQTVTYTLLKDGKFFIIENVPARVDVNSGEQYFAPQTVERLQQTIWGQRKPIRVLETAVYEFTS